MADSLELVRPEPIVIKTPTQWLVSEALALLNVEGAAAEQAYGHVTELLRGRDDATETLAGLLRASEDEDVDQRWCALYVVGDVGDESAGEMLFRAAAQSLPKACEEHEGCEGPRDGEILVRTMAIEALQRVASRHADVGELVLKLIATRPDQPVLVEAIKAAQALNLADNVRDLLRKEDRWILDIKMVPVTKLMAEPERGDETSLGYVPPNKRAGKERPTADCCVPSMEG